MFLMAERRQIPENVRVCAYLRKSRSEMKQEELYGGDVLASHAKLLEVTAASRNLVVEKVFREVVSGSTLSERPAMRALIEAVDAGDYQAIMVVHIDRLSRGDEQIQGTLCKLLRCSGAFIICPDCYYDPLYPQDMEAISRALEYSRGEFDSYCRRMNAALAVACINGEFKGSRCPMGYSKATLENGFQTLVANEDAPTIHMIFELYAEGASAYGIAEKLTDMGIAPPMGEPGDRWAPGSILQILDNEAYISISTWGKNKTKEVFSTDVLDGKKVRYKAKEYIKGEGKWEPIIEKELWDAVHERKGETIPIKRDGSLSNIFAGIMRCGECGQPLSICRNSTGRRVCHSRSRRGCVQKGASESAVIDKFIESLKDNLRDFEVKASDESAVRQHTQALEAVHNLERQLATLAKRDKRLIDMRADEGLTAEEFATSRSEVRQLREEAEERLSRAKAVLEQEVDVKQLSINVHKAIDKLGDSNVPAQDKNDFLRGFISRIDYWNESERGCNDLLRFDIVFK